MKISRILGVSVLFSLMVSTSFSQNASNVLLKINNHPYTIEDFEKVYNRNKTIFEGEDKETIEQSLDRFVLYRLKLEKAEQLGLHQAFSYKKELNEYREQLAQKYFINEEKIEQLIEEAYKRGMVERKASHLLILVPEFASAEEEKKGLDKANAIYDKIQKGLAFEQAVLQYSEDPSAKVNNGDLGYFSTFRMIYPFEDAVYNTTIGSISKPFRTKFGYHIVRVEDERPIRFYRNISHILVRFDSNESRELAEKKAKEVYQKVLNGENFEDLAIKYSDEDGVRETKGSWKYYKSENYNQEQFNEQVYGLTKKGDITPLFQTEIGWHIVRLDSIHSLPSLEKSRSDWRQKIISDGRSIVLKKDLLTHLKKYFAYKEEKNNLKKAFAKIESALRAETTYLDENLIIAQFDQQKIFEKDFFDYAKKHFQIGEEKSIESWLKYIYEEYLSETLKKYYNENLERNYPEFRDLIQEYADGLLLYDLLEKEIWKAAKDDEQGLYDYFEKNKQNYIKNGVLQKFEDVKPRLQIDYREIYEKDWEKKLREEAKVEVNLEVLEKLRAK